MARRWRCPSQGGGVGNALSAQMSSHRSPWKGRGNRLWPREDFHLPCATCCLFICGLDRSRRTTRKPVKVDSHKDQDEESRGRLWVQRSRALSAEAQVRDPSLAPLFTPKKGHPSWPFATARGDPPVIGQTLCASLQLGASERDPMRVTSPLACVQGSAEVKELRPTRAPRHRI